MGEIVGTCGHTFLPGNFGRSAMFRDYDKDGQVEISVGSYCEECWKRMRRWSTYLGLYTPYKMEKAEKKVFGVCHADIAS